MSFLWSPHKKEIQHMFRKFPSTDFSEISRVSRTMTWHLFWNSLSTTDSSRENFEGNSKINHLLWIGCHHAGIGYIWYESVPITILLQRQHPCNIIILNGPLFCISYVNIWSPFLILMNEKDVHNRNKSEIQRWKWGTKSKLKWLTAALKSKTE